MHQCNGIYIGKLVMKNQVKITVKSKSMDDVDKWRFKLRAAYHNASMMEKTLRGHCIVGESVTTSGDNCRCRKVWRREKDDIRAWNIQP